MTAAEIAALRRVSVSQGLMLETAAARLGARGGPHFGSPDKEPSARLAVIRAAGEAAVPFTSGILIGIGETRRERLEALLRLRELHERPRPHPGNHHPEFPCQGRDPDGELSGACA